MSRRRFYAPPDAISGTISGSPVELSADESHHLARVLRLGAGDEAFVFDGRGSEYLCRVVEASGKRARLEIIDALRDIVESPLDLTLGQALAKGEKFDLIVQKATELGVTRIVPLVTEHADVKVGDGQAGKRIERWERISLEALKQSGRRRLVEITRPVSVKDFKVLYASSLLLVLSERGGASISAAVSGASSAAKVAAMVGPEGGWSESELELLGEAGARFVSLGRRVLRTETAAIVAAALIQHALGDL
jgi:16S rRNA (uracil1498-N3)-methyltransferase